MLLSLCFALITTFVSCAAVADLDSDLARVMKSFEGSPRRVLPFRHMARGERVPLLLPAEILMSARYPCVQLTVIGSPFSQFVIEGEGDWSEASRLGLIDSVRCGAQRYAWMSAAIVMHSESGFITSATRALEGPDVPPVATLLTERGLGPDDSALKGFIERDTDDNGRSEALGSAARTSGALSVTSIVVPAEKGNSFEFAVESGCHELAVARRTIKLSRLEVILVEADSQTILERTQPSWYPRAQFCLEHAAPLHIRVLGVSDQDLELWHARYSYPLAGWSTTPPAASRHAARALFEHRVRSLDEPPVVSFTTGRGTVVTTTSLAHGRCYLAIAASTLGSPAPLLLSVRTSERTHFDVGERHAALVAFCVASNERAVRVTTGVEFDSSARVAVFDLGVGP